MDGPIVASLLFIFMGWIAAILTCIVDCYGPGRGNRDASGIMRYDHQCCGVMINQFLFVPLLLGSGFGLTLLVAVLPAGGEICTSMAGYCDTISCVAGAYWRAYVFLFIFLTLVPILLVPGVFQGKTKLLWFKRLRCGMCKSYHPDDGLDILDALIALLYVACNAVIVWTGMMPSTKHGGDSYNTNLRSAAQYLHDYPICAGFFLIFVIAVMVSVKKTCAAYAPNEEGVQPSCCEPFQKKDPRIISAALYIAAATVYWQFLWMFLYFLNTVPRKANKQFDVCVENRNIAECALGVGCEWHCADTLYWRRPDTTNATRTCLCYDPHCQKRSPLALTEEFALMMTGIGLLVAMAPVVRSIVRDPPSAKAAGLEDIEDGGPSEDAAATEIEMPSPKRVHPTAEEKSES